jgi:hypothetical protein
MKERENVPALYEQEGELAHGAEATDAARLWQKKNELGTNKA